MILDRIVENKKKEIQALKENKKDLFFKSFSLPSIRNFHNAISAPGKINIICEIKRFSPSNPQPIKDLNIIETANTYKANKASAISVLTDNNFFGGSFEDMFAIKMKCGLPVLCKDFILDEIQIFAAKVYGADAVLLIARILEKKMLKKLIKNAEELGMSCLVEVHNYEDLKKALSANAKIIGINNRDLDTLQIELNTTVELVKKIPKNKVIVSESGIKTRDDVLKLKDAGVHAILVGESLLRSDDIVAKMKELIN